jgi:hypothetical protein
MGVEAIGAFPRHGQLSPDPGDESDTPAGRSASMCAMRPLVGSCLVIAALSALTGCSFEFSLGDESVEDAGVELVEGELAEQLGQELSDAECESPAEEEVGEEFTCSATDENDETITFVGVIEEGDQIFVAPSNVLAAEEMDQLEAEAAAVLGPEVGVEIDPADIECPNEQTVLDDGQLTCEITDPTTGDVYALTATLSDFVLREGFQERFYEIGEQLE